MIYFETEVLIRYAPHGGQGTYSAGWHMFSAGFIATGDCQGHWVAMANDLRFPTSAGFGTRAIHTGQNPDQWNSKAVTPLISMSTTYQESEYGFGYGRMGNPTRNIAEKCVAALENGKHCLLYSSGMAAVVSLAQLLTVGNHIIVHYDIFGGSFKFFREIGPRYGIETSFVDATQVENVQKALKPNTKMLWLESPTNPQMQIIDIQAVSQVVHKHGDVIVAVDNTVASCYFQQPLGLGADCVMHSCTKYLNGHTDVIMGAVVTNDDAIAGRLKFLHNGIGAIPSPFDSYLLIRGLRTLHVRMKEHQKNALAVAHFLEADGRVEKVLHPGLRSHPQYALAARQMKGYSGMVSFFIKGGLPAANIFLRSLKVFIFAGSLGGTESLVTHPVTVTHSAIPKEEQEAIGITDTLIRLSVGLEDVGDLIQDLDQALSKALGGSKL